MGRLLIILGMLALVAGIGGMAYNFSGSFQNMMGGLMDTATTPLDATEYCNAGETLEQETGASVYTPGNGYASSIQYYCVDDAGNRRDVTGDFVENLMGGVDGIFSNVGGLVSSSLMMTGLTMVGIVLLIIGFIVSARRRASGAMAPVGVYTSGMTTRIGGTNLNDVLQQVQQFKSQQQPLNSNDLMGRLQQLEKAYEAKLITKDEYDRLREQLLNSMR